MAGQVAAPTHHLLRAFADKVTPNTWILDSGASAHMCNNERQFTSLRYLDKPTLIMIGGASYLLATAVGDVQLITEVDDIEFACIISNC